MRPSERPRIARWAAWLILASLGASGPEVVKLRVPSAKVSTWFPPGSDLHVLTPDRFEELLKAVRDRPQPSPGPRVLRARHAARWDSGVLAGRSELTLGSPNGRGTGLVVLEPWSPAIDPQADGAKRLRSTTDGRLAVAVETTTPTTVEAGWKLRARPGSDGRAFALALSDLDVSALVLDLPSGLVPEASAGPRIGPSPGSTPDRTTWTFEAARGRIDLRLRDPSEERKQAAGPTLWLEGSTRIDLNTSASNWRADWTLDESPGAPRSLTIELDAGLELIDVVGPRVASFRVEPAGPKSRLLIRLDGEGAGPSPLTLRAICHAPDEGAWVVPSAKALDANWTGGRTTIRLGPSRVLQSSEERAGRRVAPRPGELVDASTVIFEPKGPPGPVAELTFRRPTADATVDIRGHLRLGDDVPRIEVALTWTVERGRLLSHAADLPPGWTPEGVLSTLGQPVPWHGESLSNGGTRVSFGPGLPDEEGRSLTLTLAASARQAGVTGPLVLPRVRPTPGARIVDEIWAATPDPNLTLRPTFGRGLAWLDPPDPPIDDVPAPWTADDLKNALAWRWLAEDAEARIDRTPTLDNPRGEVRLDASIVRDRLRLEWSLTIDSPRGDLRAIPIHLDEAAATPIRWRSREAGGPMVEARPLGEAERATLGFPSTGSAWNLELSGPPRGRIEIRGQADRSWDRSGRIPLLTLPDRDQTRGIVAVQVEDSTRVKVDASGLTPIDLSASLGETSGSGDEPPTAERVRRAAMFAYRSAGGRLLVQTTRGEADPSGGLVREACLLTQVAPGAGLRHRLRLKIAPDSARSIELTMPQGCSLDRIRRDGQPVAPIPTANAFKVEILAPAANRADTTLSLEYRSEGDPRSGPLEPARFLPDCSLPCLTFAWDLVAPAHWSLGEVSGGLVATDPRTVPSATSKLLGFESSLWPRGEQPPSRAAREVMLRDLDKSATDFAGGETTLGDWLLKLDAGRWPLIIDRLALTSSGWGPGSRISPASPESKPLGPVPSILNPMGLAAVPLDGMILITNRTEVPADPGTFSTALREVPSHDSDPADRFQSAARWRGEATPRALAAGESPERAPGSAGWQTWRVVATGWPRAGASAKLVDERANQGWGWFVFAVVIAAGILTRNQPARIRAIGLVILGALTSIALGWTWAEPPAWLAGLVRGSLAVLAFWTGRSLRSPTSLAAIYPSDATTATRQSSLAVRAGTVGLVLVAVGLGSMTSRANPEADSPILALYPFDGPPDPNAKPDRVVLLLQDFERLKRLARPDETLETPRVSLSAASHRVARDEANLATVESTYELEVDREGSASWTLPVGLALDLAATVDGRATPLVIAADGLTATLAVSGSGSHLVRFRRLVPLSAAGSGAERTRVPINRAAFARVAVARGQEPRWVEVPGASGALEVRSDGIEGGLGPVDLLEVRWFPEDRSNSTGLQAPVDAAFLWDARPVGDLIRMKLTHSDPEGASTIRLALEPGLVVRRFSIPDVVGLRLEGTPERPEWVAHVDPPLPRDVPIEVDFWRPASGALAERRWPRIEVPGARRFSGVIGFRRPPEWSGRLEARGEIEPIVEAGLTRAWGTLPEDGLALAGAVRFARSPALAVTTGPEPLRRSVRPNVSVSLAPGRMNVAIEATLDDRQGRSFDLEMVLPTDLRIVKVEAGGLVDWQKLTRERLRLQFDGSEGPERSIRIEGYLPVPADSVMTEARSFEGKIPWPRWLDVETLPGNLLISGPNRFQFEPGDGVVSVQPVASKEPAAAFQSSFRVDRPAGLAMVRWSAVPAKVGVSVQSELTIDPTGLTWTAIILCEVSGGPADSLNWNVPTDWATGASLEIEGLPHRLVAELKGPKGETTRWTILPGSPIWGRARMVLRSKRPLVPGELVSYPEIAPLATPGRGSVERYDLAIANVSGRPLEVAGSPSLQPMDVARFRSDESPSPTGSIDHAYHVKGEKWWLRVRVGRADDGPMVPLESRVTLARLSCAIGLEGETWGRARYDLGPRPGPFLVVRLPEKAEIPWASVDGLVEPALRDGPGRWLIPLGDRQARRVFLSWHSPRIDQPGAVLHPLTCPMLDQPDVPTLVSITAPDSLEIAGRGKGLEALNRTDWEVENAERLARRLVDLLTDLDRSSRDEREQVIEDLMEIELRDRSLVRGSVHSTPATEAALGRLQASLTTLAEASQAAGLDDLIEEARARIGLAQAFEDATEAPRTELAGLVRVRRIGNAHFFRWTSADKPDLSITWATITSPPRRAEFWIVAAVGLALSLAFGRMVIRPIRPRGRVGIGLALVGALLLLAWEPLGTASALGLVGLGRRDVTKK